MNYRERQKPQQIHQKGNKGLQFILDNKMGVCD